MKKTFALILILALGILAPASAFAINNIHGAIGLTGGTAGKLDAIPSAGLNDKDGCIVIIENDYTYVYVYDASSSTAESSPAVIAPDDIGGNGRWELQAFYCNGLQATGTATISGLLTASAGITTGGGTVKAWRLTKTLADDATYDFATVGSGGIAYAFATAGDDYGGTWGIGSGAESYAFSTANGNIASTDSDGDVCLFDGGSALTIKNRLGHQTVINFLYFYNP